ncbi:FIP1[V]-like protein isoform X1 [Arabidopsis lyrata subsp. lyrata]|uniref:FIP1[V]-like protein isoform X1 n=1 Tax=Arabidopsis lyrata subsp. lyrata TaxID=81972 RepID=UPI000A29C928|nr:FIP1[V]-like protein isoform X1 [Arabidopsis lyrata subsp. lyrata]|eukprot:XP_020871134.1 FIP1[V]-like protein isoform X1 [Arabidopsis lyrata subsp. lyrata]
MEEDDEFGDLYSDVLQPFQPPVVLPPPPPLPLRSIDLNLRSQDQDVTEPNSASISRVSDNDALKLSTTLSQDATRQAIVDGGGDDKDMSFDIEEPDADSTPTIPGLFVTASEAGALPGLATDRGVSQVTTRIEQQVGGGGDGQGEGDDWDSDSEDDLQIVLNDSSRNVMIGGADRRSRMGDNEDDDDEDDEDPLVIVADTDPNQPMEEQLWGEDGLQGIEGDGKDGGEAGKGSGPGGATGPPKAGYSSHGYHPFHSQFKYVRPGAAPIPGGAASVGGTSSGQVRPPANLGPLAGRGRGDWRPLGMRNASAAQKGFHQPWGSNTAGRGLDFTLPSHKTIFEVDIESFEEKPWRYPGVDMTDYFNFGLNEESWKDYCKQLDQHRIETTMQSRIRVYESGRTDQGYDPDLPPELAAATGAQGVPVDSSNLVKPDSVQGDSAKVPANVRPSLPPGRPIPVEAGSGERLPSIDTRAPRMRDLDAIIEIVCQDSHEDEPSGENGTNQADSSLPEENVPVETSYVNSRRPDTESAEHSPAQDEPLKNLLKKQDDEISRSTDSGQSFRSSSPVGDRGTRSSSVDRENVGGEAGKDVEMGEEHKMSSKFPQSAVQEDDGGESKTERSSESSKARSGSHKDYQQLKDGAEEEVIQDKHYTRPASNRKQHDNNAPHQSRKNQDRGKEVERTRAASKGGRENSNPHMELDSSYIYSIANREDFDKRKERDVDGGVWRRKEDDPYSRRGGDDGSRKRDREDDPGFRQRGKMRENEIRSKDDHVPSRKHMDDAGMRNNYEADDHISKRRKDEEYLRRSRPEKNEISYGQRESISRLKRERDDRLEHQKRDVQHKIRDDFDDHSSLRHRDDIYMQRDGNERLRERDDLDKLKLTHEDGISARGRERQVAVRAHRGSEDRLSRMKDEYKASDKDHLTKDTLRHAKQTKRRDYPGEESSSHHRGHEDFSARTDDIVNNEKKPRQERTGAKIDKFIDTLDGQRLQDRKHKDSRRKIKEQREGTESLRSKQGEQNGSSVVTGSKGTNEARNCRSENPQQPNPTKRHKENASSGDELHDSKRGRTKLERWASHKERDDTVSAKSSSISSKLEEKDKNTNGRLSEPVHGSISKSRDVTEEKSGHNLAETKDGSEKGPGDWHLDTVEKLKKRSERFKLPMPTEKDTTGVKKMESETLPSAKIEGPVDSEVKAERPARKRRWTSS